MSGMYDQPSTSDRDSADMKAFPHAPFVPMGSRAGDAVANIRAGEERSREMQVEIETVKLLRQDVISCYRREGVNHYANCRKEVDKYVECISDPNLLNPRQRMKDKLSKE
eukprot:CAMPEP_0118639532 /NCGR_PEP_ID=MMETSP0785-20121206/4272_1 /TAXON_ID=91992 /ORGANISM="Bolidomonas pacifica, Strain CCMP 1866" /LENGTH=109 /DNA_ID=CAMNT_0006530863 /DNA_START=18 /DNA_END=344 /DNA_ORIENTATION=+